MISFGPTFATFETKTPQETVNAIVQEIERRIATHYQAMPGAATVRQSRALAARVSELGILANFLKASTFK